MPLPSSGLHGPLVYGDEKGEQLPGAFLALAFTVSSLPISFAPRSQI